MDYKGDYKDFVDHKECVDHKESVVLDSVVRDSHYLYFGMDRYFYKEGEVEDSTMVGRSLNRSLNIGFGHNCCKGNYIDIDIRNSVYLDNFSGMKNTATDYYFVHLFESRNCDHLFLDFSVAVAFPFVNGKPHCYQI